MYRPLVVVSVIALSSSACTSTEDEKPSQQWDQAVVDEMVVEMSELFCGRLASCECMDPSEVDACVEFHVGEFTALFDRSRDFGLSFDDECFQQVIDAVDVVGCDTEFPDVLDEMESCSLTHGFDRTGDACEFLSPGIDTCLPGLECAGAVCVEVGDLLEGEQCGSDAPRAGDCAAGLYCSESDQTYICKPEIAEGGDCHFIDKTPCVAGYFCDGLGPGDVDGFCAIDPVVGEPCLYSVGSCQGDAWCDYDLPEPTCVPAAALGEACGGQEECGSDLLCDLFDGVCVETPPAVCTLFFFDGWPG